jgi:hypothetical protein
MSIFPIDGDVLWSKDLPNDRYVHLSFERQIAFGFRTCGYDKCYHLLFFCFELNFGKWKKWPSIEITKPMAIIIKPHDGEYMASFEPANQHMQDGTPLDAIEGVLEGMSALAELGHAGKLAGPAAKEHEVLKRYVRWKK